MHYEFRTFFSIRFLRIDVKEHVSDKKMSSILYRDEQKDITTNMVTISLIRRSEFYTYTIFSSRSLHA